MDVWTEVVTEDIADVYIEGSHVLVPLENGVDVGDVKQVKDTIRARSAWEYQLRELRENIERSQAAVKRLEGTEYEGML